MNGFRQWGDQVSAATMTSGSENLEVMSEATRYLSHVGGIVARHLPVTGNLVELGSGDGTQTGYTLLEPNRLVCVEPNTGFHSTLRAKNYRVATTLLELPEAEFNGAFSINCLEHIPDDVEALAQLVRVVKKGSPIVVYVPAFNVLYSTMDRTVGHVRRYRRRELMSKYSQAGLHVSDARYVDSLGWFVALLYRLLPGQSGTPRVAVVKFFDRFVFPLSLVLDKVLGRLIGKNLLIVGIKV